MKCPGRRHLDHVGSGAVAPRGRIPRFARKPWLVVAGLAASLALIDCDRSGAETPPPIPEPREALRPPAERGSIPEEAHVVDYVLRARLDPSEHSIDGHARITWRNRTDHATDVLPMHLYMNAFRAEDTAWMREGRGTHRGQGQGQQSPWGYTDIRRVTRASTPGPDGEQDASTLPWAEGDDPSVMTVQLSEPVPPGGEITIDVDFVTVLPEVFARTGYHDDFYMAGQWFPKVGVFEPDGTWQAHVFTFHSEFYADFGDYEVHIDVPSDMIVGATGIRTDERVETGRKVVTHVAEMVHDFAWTAWPGFVERWGEHEGIRIRQLLPPEELEDAPAHLQAVVDSLQSMQRRFGPYPWSTITVVHPPDGAEGAGGMEYPTLFTTSDRVSAPAFLQWLGFEERVSGTFTTIHEFGHQYFQGLLASNESAQPWLDEGMNTTANALVLMDRFEDPDPWLVRVAGHPLHLEDFLRMALRRSSGLQPVDQPAHAFSPIVGAYAAVVYQHTAAVMLTLRNWVGADPFDEALRRYAERWRFRHPIGADLEAALVETIGPSVLLAEAHPELPGSGPVRLDVRGYLEQGLRTARRVDFRLHRVLNRPLPGETGWHRSEEGELVGGDEPGREHLEALDDARVEAVVVVQREGDFEIPVEVEVEFSDGERTRVVWDGRDRFVVFRFAGRRVVRAGIDPDRRLLLEIDRLDNNRWAPDTDARDPIARGIAGFGQAAALAVLGGLGP